MSSVGVRGQSGQVATDDEQGFHMTDDLTPITLRPGEEGYTEAATTYVHPGPPALVFRPRDAAEVAAAIQYARSHGLLLSVRSGGHAASHLS